MCWCTPEIRTPWCGKPGCTPPVRSECIEASNGGALPDYEILRLALKRLYESDDFAVDDDRHIYMRNAYAAFERITRNNFDLRRALEILLDDCETDPTRISVINAKEVISKSNES